jgi:uncharacterized repeat protein (TIGR03943 family)
MTQHTHTDDHHHAPSGQAWVQAGILLALAVYMALLMLTGNINNYINERFQWLVVLASVIFAVLGAFQVWCALRPQAHDHDHDHHDHDHDHSVSWGVLAVVSVPLMLALAFPSRPLGVEAITAGVSLNAVGVGNAQTFTRAPKDRNILDWLREFNRVGNPASFNGQEVDVIGFIYREATMPAGEFMIARFTMSCCVADAFAIGLPVRVDAQTAAQFATGTWVRVQGTLQAGVFNGESVPILQPTDITPTDVPASPYLYS